MATLKKRINISVSNEVETAVAILAKRDQVPHATKAAELLELALEIEEDGYFSRLIEERTASNTKWILHSADIWK